MNKLSGIIKQIQKSGAIVLVDFDVEGQTFSALTIESTQSDTWLQEGNHIDAVFKEPEVSLAHNLTGLISMRNRMKCKVTMIETGVLLTKITLLFFNNEIHSIITTRALKQIQIKIGDEIEALIKSNEIALMKKK